MPRFRYIALVLFLAACSNSPTVQEYTSDSGRENPSASFAKLGLAGVAEAAGAPAPPLSAVEDAWTAENGTVESGAEEADSGQGAREAVPREALSAAGTEAGSGSAGIYSAVMGKGAPRQNSTVANPRREGGLAVRHLPLADYLRLAPYLRGVASWYGPAFHGKPTANGEIYNQFELTVAHPVLPMDTRIMVENLENGARVWLRVNDRGPYKKGRVIDLSRAAAVRLGMISKGTAPVRISVVAWPAGLDPRQGLRAYHQFVVQVGAFPDPAKAENHRRGLKGRFQDVPFRITRTPAGLFAIYAGPYDDERSARVTAAVMRRGGVTSLVRSYRK